MAPPNKKSVFIATPTLDGSLDCRFVSALLKTITSLTVARIGYEFCVEIGNSIIADARNKLVSRFLCSEHTDMVFIDSDLSWIESDFLKLLSYDVPFLAGVYQRKSSERVDFTVKFGSTIVNEPNGLLEVERVGTGFMRIRRDCLEALMSCRPDLRLKDRENPTNTTLYALFDTSIVDGRFVGEDFTFCDRLRASGGKVLIDPNLNFSHFGTKAFDEPLMKFLRKN